MTPPKLRYVVLGLSITSSWGNGHATTYRALLRELAARGHDVLFLERDLPFYASNRDLPRPPYCRTELYGSLDELRDRFADAIREADLVIVGSYVPEGIAVGAWVTSIARAAAFYDIDTPVTLSEVARGECAYLSSALVPRYDLYLSFTGGPTLQALERRFGAQMARALYCSVDPTVHHPEQVPLEWSLGYLGTYSDDRQPALDALMLDPARQFPEGRFVVAGPQYPPTVRWPANVAHVQHLPPSEHRAFYCAQRFTLNVTRRSMVRAGYSPSVRLFEAAACATPIISDAWTGLETIFRPGAEILIARSGHDTLHYLRTMRERDRLAVGRRARERVLREHTAAHRAEALERCTLEALERRARRRSPAVRRPDISPARASRA